MAGNTTHSSNDTTGVAANGARTLDTAADAAGVETRDHAAASYGIFEAVGAAVGPCSAATGERDALGWMGVLEETSQAMNALAAARDAAIVRLAAVDERVTEDGVIGEQVNSLGQVCLDAAAMIATTMGITTRFADDLLTHALTRCVKVPALHAAMAAGVLDDYKARCIGNELFDVPPDLARAVVHALGPDLADRSGPALKSRARAILFTLAPDLLSERIRANRNAISLRQNAGDPGVENWVGVFPSEQAARAWAGIDALARQYKNDGRYPTLEQARAHALLDLFEGNTTIETILHLTIPATALTTSKNNSSDSEPQSSDSDHSDGDTTGDEGAAEDASAAIAEEPGADADADVVAGEAFVAVKGSRRDETVWMPLGALTDAVTTTASTTTSNTSTSASACASSGAGIDGSASKSSSTLGEGHGSSVVLADGWQQVVCDPVTGALLPSADDGASFLDLSSDAYEPSGALRAFITRRDGRCRFPGCVLSVRQCDLDHVIAWPLGPTAPGNLIALCRRHHRIKQRHRWRVRLLPDARVQWINPAGKTLTTDPINHLGAGTTTSTLVRAATSTELDEVARLDYLENQWRHDRATPPAIPLPLWLNPHTQAAARVLAASLPDIDNAATLRRPEADLGLTPHPASCRTHPNTTRHGFTHGSNQQYGSTRHDATHPRFTLHRCAWRRTGHRAWDDRASYPEISLAADTAAHVRARINELLLVILDEPEPPGTAPDWARLHAVDPRTPVKTTRARRPHHHPTRGPGFVCAELLAELTNAGLGTIAYPTELHALIALHEHAIDTLTDHGLAHPITGGLTLRQPPGPTLEYRPDRQTRQRQARHKAAQAAKAAAIANGDPPF